MSKNIRSSVPGSSGVRCASAIRCARATAASWLECPKVNSRSKIPTVEGAYTSSNTRGVPPARSRFASSMLSAPHIMPAMIVVSFPAGLTAPDLTRVLGRSTCSPINRERPVCSASSSTGTKPPADTRFRSSNTADSMLNVCDDCTGNAFRNRATTTSTIVIVPVQKAFSLFTRRSSPTDHPRILNSAPGKQHTNGPKHRKH